MPALSMPDSTECPEFIFDNDASMRLLPRRLAKVLVGRRRDVPVEDEVCSDEQRQYCADVQQHFLQSNTCTHFIVVRINTN